MGYTRLQRQQINLRAKRKVGQLAKDDSEAQDAFVEQCVSDMVDSGEAVDEDSAEEICQTLWEDDQQGDG